MNELLFFVTVVLCFSTTLLFYKLFGKTGLLIWIAIATITANIQTVKLVNLFGIESALGNVLYASSFLTTDILNEKYGKKAALKALYIGFASMIAMTLFMSLALIYTPSASDFANESLNLIFSLNIRITIASVLGYGFSQLCDTYLFQYLKGKKVYLWIRNNVSTMISQIIDTLVFVLVSYVGLVDINTLIAMMISMYVFKFVIAILDTPFMYLSRKIKPMEE
ncbi:MAG: VUT family protein [Firmicutes bacterium]|nr:VUT family protein [Bacillota bacterium]